MSDPRILTPDEVQRLHAEEDEVILSWLRARGPDDWHRVVAGWNWDMGFAPFVWVAAQPECDRATAQRMIMGASPDYFVKYPDRDAARGGDEKEIFDLLAGLIERWNAGSLTRSEIASHDPAFLRYAEESYATALAERGDAPMPWQLDPAVFQPIEGRQVEPFHDEGWPPEIWEKMGEDSTD